MTLFSFNYRYRLRRESLRRLERPPNKAPAADGLRPPLMSQPLAVLIEPPI